MTVNTYIIYSSALNPKAAMLLLITGAVAVIEPLDDGLSLGFMFIKPKNLKTQSEALRARVNIGTTCHGSTTVGSERSGCLFLE